MFLFYLIGIGVAGLIAFEAFNAVAPELLGGDEEEEKVKWIVCGLYIGAIVVMLLSWVSVGGYILKRRE